MEYEHKGIKIDFEQGSGWFSAIIAGKVVYAPSLTAIKARIDKHAQDTFTPFKALRWDQFDSKQTVVNVVGVRNPKKNDRYNRRKQWILDDGDTREVVAAYTPENLARIKEYEKRYREVAKAKEQLIDELDALRAAIVTLKPE